MSRFRAELQRMGRRRFLREHTAPVLIGAEQLAGTASASSFKTAAASPARGGLASPRLGADALVWVVRKRLAAFPDRITLGRTPNNDVLVAEPGVSKFHAFFPVEAGRWRIVDAGSSNGTRVGDRVLPELEPADLLDGCVLQLGTGVTCLWCLPETFSELLAQPPRA